MKLKPFQVSTAEAALHALQKSNGARRFLIADEVGLGKTVVAQEIIRRLCAKRSSPLCVFYVCSNLSIARQNQRKLLEFLPEGERDDALCPVDRLTLMPADNQPQHAKLHLYTLTPETSIPMRKGRRRDGNQVERALIHALVETAYPWFFRRFKRTFFKRNARRWWKYWLDHHRENIPRIAGRFKEAVRRQFGLEHGTKLSAALRGYDKLDVIALFRNALAACALDQVQPDIVIFDEFQRFRDLVDVDLPMDESASQIIRALRGDAKYRGTSLLLLSATPYRLYTTRREESMGGNTHHKEFFDLVEFLYGGTTQAKAKRQGCEQAFARLEQEIRKGDLRTDTAKAARKEVQDMLRPVMSRTERLHVDGGQHYSTKEQPEHLQPGDLRIFCHLSNCLRERHRFSAVHYWNSIPYPMQTMGPSYRVWHDAEDIPDANVPQIVEAQRNRFECPEHWNHPKLRALQELFPKETLSRPWAAPSLPWWPLGSLWKDARSRPQKALLFSRFRAVPTTVASLLSYDLECHHLRDSKISYENITRRRLLQATGERHALLGLFHPSPWLVSATDPLAEGRCESADAARALVRRQLIGAFTSLGVPVREEGSPRPLWALIARIDAAAGKWDWIRETWAQLHEENQFGDDLEAGLGRLLRRWNREAQLPLDHVTPKEVDLLAYHAISAPGIILGRAIQRHWRKAVSEEGFREVLSASWNYLRTYLDQRWFAAALAAQHEEAYPGAIQRAALEGNLEAVLDEHLWLLRQIYSCKDASLVKELRAGLALRSSRHWYHVLGGSEQRFSLRCHAAMPFTEARLRVAGEDGDEDAPFRPDDLRKAFNSPFWPHILATTSVGQEGLDFHAWCHTIIHWDLCGNPVDLEQREGRIQRYGGLAVRIALAQRFGDRALSIVEQKRCPWKALARLAESEFTEPSGLAPWWVCPGADIERYVLEIPTSDQKYLLDWLKQQRMLYRLVLGQPNQEDLLEILRKDSAVGMKEVREVMLNLSAFDWQTPTAHATGSVSYTASERTAPVSPL